MIAAGGDQDVVRLDVAVDQACFVRGVERVTGLGEDAQRAPDSSWRATMRSLDSGRG